MDKILLGWTTVETREAAEKLARQAVAAKMAACVQIDGPIFSVYPWRGAVEAGEEFRLLLKFPVSKAGAVAEWLQAHHPYEVPEWVVTETAESLPGYRQWVIDCCAAQ